jgi:hypothetical protein
MFSALQRLQALDVSNISTLITTSIVGVDCIIDCKLLGLKRKFSLSYFRKNFAKICFRFSRKTFAKTFAKTKMFCENFRENEIFRGTKFREITRKLAHFRFSRK